jgi:sugar-specific transcriptional regulator TrmB
MLNKEDLLELGLTNNEAEVYLILLKLKESKAYDIAKQTTISRSHVYDSLNILTAKGLANYLTKNKKRFYRITNPENLINILKEKQEKLIKKEEELKIKLSELNEKEKITTSKVEVYEGIEGIKYILNDIIKEGTEKQYKEILVMNSFSKEEFTKQVPEYVWERFWNMRKRYKIPSRQLFAKGKNITMHKYVKSKVLPKEYFNDNVVHSIYGNKMVYFIFSLKPLVIKIESEEIANLYKNQFEILWKTAK